MMFQMIYLVLAVGAVGVAVVALTGPLRGWLIVNGVYDAPNERSLHAALKPRGGGIAVLAVVLPAWFAAAAVYVVPSALWPVLAGALALAAVSFADDVRGLHPAPRFAVQTLAVAAALAAFGEGMVLQGLVPFWADRLLAALAWLWFVNLFNFMDGIDGISGVETASIGFGLGFVALVADQGAVAVALPWILGGAAVGFLAWNWAPAKIFLGDVGSIPLGYLLGWLLLQQAAAGQWAPALILPAYYLIDATWTLIRRILRGAKPWRAHREHAYQVAVHRGAAHAGVARTVALGNGGLIALALGVAVVGLSGTGGNWASAGGLVAACALVVLLMRRFLRYPMSRDRARRSSDVF